jgi:uncharacterized membrane protein
MMETKKTKYDTNPLDPDFEKKTEEDWGGGTPTQEVKGATREVGNPASESARQNVYSEAPTRRYDEAQPDGPYPSVFIPPTYSPPAQHQPTQLYQPVMSPRPSSRPVLGFGIPEKWAVMLPYAPFYIGLIVSLLELFLVPRKEVTVRFHASQALTLHIAILIIQTVFSVISSITDSSFGGFLFNVAAFIFLVVSMARVWQGQPHHITALSEPAKWFNDRIEPRNRG